MTMPYNDSEPSEYFLKSLEGGGGPHVTCCCGIDYYATDNTDGYYDDWPEPPEESYTVVHVPYGSVEYKTLDGNGYVLDCDKCMKRLRRYEDFIWEERGAIRDYLKSRIAAAKKWAEYEFLQNIIAGFDDDTNE